MAKKTVETDSDSEKPKKKRSLRDQRVLDKRVTIGIDAVRFVPHQHPTKNVRYESPESCW